MAIDLPALAIGFLAGTAAGMLWRFAMSLFARIRAIEAALAAGAGKVVGDVEHVAIADFEAFKAKIEATFEGLANDVAAIKEAIGIDAPEAPAADPAPAPAADPAPAPAEAPAPVAAQAMDPGTPDPTPAPAA